MSDSEWPEDENDLTDEELLAMWDVAVPVTVIPSPSSLPQTKTRANGFLRSLVLTGPRVRRLNRSTFLVDFLEETPVTPKGRTSE